MATFSNLWHFVCWYRPVSLSPSKSASPGAEEKKNTVRAEDMLLLIDLNKEVGKSVPTPESQETACSDSLWPVSKLDPATTNLHHRHTALHGRQLDSVLPTLPTLLDITMVINTADHWVEIYWRKSSLGCPSTIKHEMIPAGHSSVSFAAWVERYEWPLHVLQLRLIECCEQVICTQSWLESHADICFFQMVWF